MNKTSKQKNIPTEALPVLPLRRGVIFPGGVVTLPVGRRRSLKLVRDLEVGSLVVILPQKSSQTEQPEAVDLHAYGTLASVEKIVRRNGYVQLMIQGQTRVGWSELTQESPYLKAHIHAIQETNTATEEAKALADRLLAECRSLLPDKQMHLPESWDDEPGTLADRIASLMSLSQDEEWELLSTFDVEARLRRVSALINQMQARAEVRQSIEEEVKKGFSNNQREAVLREQLRAIKKELGEDGNQELDTLRTKLGEVSLPEDVQTAVDRELERMEAMSPSHAEYNVLRKYLEWIADMPWDKRTEVNDDLDDVESQLNADHYGLEDIKRGILEHLAVHKMSGNKRGTIMCFVGPPGVGKTSLGRSIAEATGREFVRISLGGVRDEAEIRGHRRTYIGALPGRIIAGLKKAKTKNPVFLLDEIDKLGKGWNGDPQAALLEVLDPEQNNTFTDHYIEHPFDLSEVFFICTANGLETISPPLRDRLEIIELSGYTEHEKKHIAKQHLLPKQLDEHGLQSDAVTLSDDVLRQLIREYTREAGVRQLNRELQKLCRGATLTWMRQTDERPHSIQIEEEQLRSYLGKPKFFDEVAERLSTPGVAVGLAWTPTGGDVLFVETSRMPGKGRLETTGQLGDVMKESARAALTYIRSRAETLGIAPDFIESNDIHIHVPAGAIPKDGPSAGITMFSALASLLTGRPIRPDTAMTGECTLRGKVLPVGGIKSKVLAAHRAGIKRIILPVRNERDLDDIPQEIAEEMEWILATDMSEVLHAALDAQPVAPTNSTGKQANLAA